NVGRYTIKKVQVGTEQTAAELAFVRLSDELKVLTVKAAYLTGNVKLKIPTLVFSGFFFLVAGVVLFNWHDVSGGVVVFLLGMLASGIYLLKCGLESSRQELTEVKIKIDELNRRISEQKAVVDS